MEFLPTLQLSSIHKIHVPPSESGNLVSYVKERANTAIPNYSITSDGSSHYLEHVDDVDIIGDAFINSFGSIVVSARIQYTIRIMRPNDRIKLCAVQCIPKATIFNRGDVTAVIIGDDNGYTVGEMYDIVVIKISLAQDGKKFHVVAANLPTEMPKPGEHV